MSTRNETILNAESGPTQSAPTPGARRSAAAARASGWVDLSTVRWALGRIVFGFAAVIIVMSAVFFVTRSTSDPARKMLPLGSSQEQIDALNARLGLDDPLWMQYEHFLSDMFHLDFGRSIWEGRPALEVVVDRLPVTFTLVGLALLISIVVFVPLGVIASLRPGSLTDRLVTALSLAGLSAPQFWLGAMLVLVFAVELDWFPTSGSGSMIYAVLPAVTLAFTMGGRLAQVTRTSFLDQAGSPYVTMARAKGLSTFYILRRHVLRNALLPILTIASWDTARAITGHAVVVEVVFAWPGFGRLVIESVQRQDFPVIQACVFIGAVLIVVINVVTDVLNRIIEPRMESR
ncbi:ABC transporter permease [Nocardioides astragali]|uniref:ABC transporter permease n=1 Tax=Nocardioides astragali TaxID=1776736 RepID=A0ABW2N942_9ACTN|nr:ABC transporter permease [Nocardioides astragali]